MPSDVQHLGFIKEVLTVIFGLEPQTLDRVVRAIKNSQDISDIKTNMVRARIGARAMKYIRQAVEIARHEGIEKHEKEEEPDESKEADLDPMQLQAEKQRKKQHEKKSESSKQTEVKESLSFLRYLTEIMVDINQDDDQTKVRQKIRNATQRPERTIRNQIAAAKEQQRKAAESNSPTAALEARIARKKIEIANLEKQLAAMKKRDRQARR